MLKNYMLIGQSVVPADTSTPEGVLRFGESLQDSRVSATTVLGLAWVATDFMGMDLSCHLGGPPLVFETMAFWPGTGCRECARCSTWLQAEETHRRMCAEVARPRAVLGWIGALWGKYWIEAATAWLRAWREQRGIPESDDAHLRRMEALGDALDA